MDAPAGPPALADQADALTAAGQTSIAPRAYLPLLLRPEAFGSSPPQDRNDTLAYINYFRSITRVPLVNFNQTLNNNCYLHARYMAEENHLTHDERTNSQWYTPQGQLCAQKGNAWLGSSFYQPYWQPYHSIDGWMKSVGHRIWLLYPTTPTFGYGFYTAANNRAGAALDVLTYLNVGADLNYTGWPVRYPAPGQVDVPAQAYSITMFWRYTGAVPTVSGVSLTTASGEAIPHTVTTALPVGHKGVEIRPTGNLPANTTINVTVNGTYDGRAYSQSWSFKTGG